MNTINRRTNVRVSDRAPSQKGGAFRFQTGGVFRKAPPLSVRSKTRNELREPTVTNVGVATKNQAKREGTPVLTRGVLRTALLIGGCSEPRNE